MTSDKTTSNTRKPITNDERKRTTTPKATSPIPAAPTAPKVRATHPCLCSCGTPTGGLFAPGHDAKLHSWERAIARDPKTEVPPIVTAALARWVAARTAITAKRAARAAKSK